MDRRVRSPYIAERVATTQDSYPARHCWVIDAVDGCGVKRAGLLMELRHRSAEWEGRVVYAAELRPGQWALVEEWVAAALLAPL